MKVEKPDAPAWPVGGGEMGALIRAHDWAATPLGPVEGWPVSLRVATDLALGCAFPTLVLWGPDLLQVYNDACRDLMGARHPAALGQPSRECWPEAWHLLEPIFRRVRQGEAVLLEDSHFRITRHGYPEDAYFTQCYSPVRDDTGAVAGVLVTGVETTEVVRNRALEEARYRALFEAIDEGFCIVEMLFDADGRPVDYRFEEANPAFEAMTGLRGALGRTARELVPGLEPFWFETYGRVALTGEPVRFENESVPMGRWFDVHASRLGGPGSRKVAIVFTNITARKEAEAERARLLAAERAAHAAVEAERARLRDLFMQAPAAIAVLRGPEHIYTLANPGYAEIFGPHRDYIDRPVRAVFADVDQPAIWETLDGVYRSGEPFVGTEWPVQLDRRGEGTTEERSYNFVFRPTRGPDGAVDGIFILAIDVTAQVRARRELEAEVAKRARAEALLTGQRAVLELIARGAPLAETLGALARLIESESDDLLCSILLLDQDGLHLRHGAAPGLPEAYNRAIDGIAIGPAVGSCGTAAFRGEPVVVADIAADPLWADFRDLAAAYGLRACWSTPIRSAGGQVLGTFAVYFRAPREPAPRERERVEALTYLAGIAIERGRVEEEREGLLAAERAARTAAEEAVRARDTFLSIAAHELKTPLTALKGGVQLLARRQARGLLDAEGLAGALGTLDRSVDRLVTLTDDLLDVSRIRTGQLPLTLRPTDLAALVRDATARIRERGESDHALTVGLPADLPPVPADAGRIEQVLINLLDNAVKYSPAGGEVAVTARAGADGVAVAVRDEGIGLPPEALTTIFEPFGRAANAAASNLPGMGLGLYICRNIIERHGGHIRAESAGEGRGTTVTFWLPFAGPAVTETAGG
jgi:PAS domain S-box-containing protein